MPIDPKAVANAFKAKLRAVSVDKPAVPMTELELVTDAEKTFADLWAVLTGINSAVREKFGVEAGTTHRLSHLDTKYRAVVGEIAATKPLRQPYRVTFKIQNGRIWVKAFLYEDGKQGAKRYDYAPGENLDKLIERLIEALTNYFGL
ncbi:MAG: hypothetical protein ACHQF3_08570 [Alphaproteobacteria bacterium]